jgi:hypothetical protein
MYVVNLSREYPPYFCLSLRNQDYCLQGTFEETQTTFGFYRFSPGQRGHQRVSGQKLGARG